MPVILENTEYFTLKEIADYCSKHVDTIRRWKKDGKVEVQGKKELSSGRLLFTAEEREKFYKFATAVF